MRLVDLEPKWFSPHGLGVGVEVYTGLTFLCPCRQHRIPVHFSNALIVQMPPIPGFEWPKMTGWHRDGDSFDTLTLSPSIRLTRDCGWHGFITNGQVVNT